MIGCQMVELFDTYGVLHIGTSTFYFDLDNLPIVQSRRWYVDNDGYLTSSYYYLGRLRIVRFHRIVANAKPGQWVDHRRNRWAASITYNSKRIFIGRFQNKDDAIAARLETEIRLFGEFSPQLELYESYKGA